LVVLAALALACAGAPAAQADLTWSTSPQSLTPAGTTAKGVKVATDAAGDAVAVWLQYDPSNLVTRVAEAVRPAGSGSFGSPTFISDTSSDASAAYVAMNAGGAAIATWNQTGSQANTLEAYDALRPAGGTFGFQQVVSHGTWCVNGQPAIDTAGDVIVGFTVSPGPDSGPFDEPDYFEDATVEYKRASQPDFGGPQVVSQQYDQTGAGPYPVALTAPQVVMNASGQALVTWIEDWDHGYGPSAEPDDDFRVETAFRAGDNGDDPDYPNFDPPATISTPGEAYTSFNPSAAIDANGNALVIFGEAQGEPEFSSEQPGAVRDAYRPAAQGSFDATETLASFPNSEQEPDAGNGDSVAFDPSGNAYAVWSGPTPANDTNQVSAAYRPAAGDFGSAVTVATGDVGLPLIGVDSQGRQSVEWTTVTPSQNPQATPQDTVQAASRDATSGSFTAATNLSTTANLSLADGVPDFAVSASGQAVAVWQLDDGLGSLIAQARIGGLTAPPPPPPPPPPIPNPIVAAATIQRGHSIVLTADVAAGIQRLDWKFSGIDGTFTGTVVNGQLQNSVRLHPRKTTLTATVTAVGPAGSHTYSRQFVLPAALTDRDSEIVSSALNDAAAPPVVAVGDAPTLLGNTVCGQLTVYADNQQTSGCMRPVNVLTDIPNRELGAIQAMARSLGLDPNDTGLMSSAVQQVDGYVGVGTATLDSKWPVVPNPGASIVTFPGIGSFTSSGASIDVGGLKFGAPSGGFSLDINPLKFDVPLGNLPKPSLPDIGGFPLIGDWNISLGDLDATIDTSIQLPSWLSIGGVPLHIPITFRATPSGLVLNSLNIGPINANLGPLNVTKLHLTYDRPSDTWTGSGSVCLFTGACLDMSPPDGEVKIVHGALNYAGATLVFPEGSGIPLFAGVDLTKIGFGIGLDPTRIIGRGAISVLDLVQLNGELVTGFPTAGHPFILARDEVGNDFPPEDYGVPFTEPTIGASADVSVNLPDIGALGLGSGYLLFEVPDYIAVGGGFNVNVLGVVQLYGNIGGAANFRDHTVDLGANAGACLLFITKICASAVVNISRAPNDGGGAGGCIDIDGFHIGGGVLWSGPKVVVWPFDGCKWSRFKVDVKPSIASAAAGTQTIVVKRGAPNPALELHGTGAAPLVRVTGPGGQSLDSTDKGFDYSPGGHIRILRYQGQTGDFTIVGLEHAQPGRYMVSTLPGSVPFTEIDSATDPPDAHVTANVTGSGGHRVLTYDIRNRPDQTVTFSEINTGGAAQAIGTVHGGGKGHIRFTPAPGKGRRTIVAQFTLAGLAAERMTVAHFNPPKPELATPRGLRVSRHKKKIMITWRAVAGAAKYDVVLTDGTTGYQHLATTRHHTLQLTGVPLNVGGTVTVRATDQLRQSLTASAKVKRLSNPTSQFQKLGHCKLSKKKLTCTGGPPSKKHKKPKKPKKPKKRKKRKKR
jgi:hypothetical protein